MKITEVYDDLKTMTDEFFAVSYEMLRFSDSSEEIDCVIYIKGIGQHKAKTFKLALDKVKESMGKIEPDGLDGGGEG
uniref:Uncharacterized protein n=1 Tax=viral metagenome TaxID=1070528 RepID=A0A6M3LU65_9ZZZZ